MKSTSGELIKGTCKRQSASGPLEVVIAVFVNSAARPETEQAGAANIQWQVAQGHSPTVVVLPWVSRGGLADTRR